MYHFSLTLKINNTVYRSYKGSVDEYAFSIYVYIYFPEWLVLYSVNYKFYQKLFSIREPE